MKVLSIVGARPQFIKAAPVKRALTEAGVTEQLLHTGQHYDANMSDVFFVELGIPRPDYQLGVGSGNHGDQTGRMLQGIESVLLQAMPDAVLVYGDTNSTIAGALAAAKLHIPVAHVEAGLRSFNRRMPEEINRIVADHVADLLFAPTQPAVDNLAREGITGDKVRLVGDVMYDAAVLFAAKADAESSILQRLGLPPGKYVLATIHRAENTDEPATLRSIFAGLAEVADQWKVILPLHPRTRAALTKAAVALPSQSSGHGFVITNPLGYLDMINLERNAALIITDSGGVQKEAYFHRVPCVTLRAETEWVELVAAGWNCLCPPDQWKSLPGIVSASVGTKGAPVTAYGKGNAAQLIASALLTICK